MHHIKSERDESSDAGNTISPTSKEWSPPSVVSAESLEGMNEKLSSPALELPLAQPQPNPAELVLAVHKAERSQGQHQKIGDKQAVDPFAHLPEHESEILSRQVNTPDVTVGFLILFQHASKLDVIILFTSFFCAVVAGAAMPLMTVVFGGLTGMFTDYFNGSVSRAAFDSKLDSMVLYFVYLAIGEFITTYIYVVGFIYVGEHCSQKIREEYLRALLRQNIAFFDQLGAGEITTRITADTNVIQDGISEKLGLTFNALATFIAAFVIAFIRSWKLTLIMFSGVIALLIIMGVVGSAMVSWTTKSQEEYAKGGTIAEEVISSIRNATAFNTQQKLARQYDAFLVRASGVARKVQVAMGVMIASMMCIINLMNALAFWEGSRLIVSGDTTVSRIITVSFAVIIGAFALGNVAPNAKAFSSAIAAGKKIFSTIARVSAMNPDSLEGERPDIVRGEIELRHVKHIYPSRPEVVVMDGVSLHVPPGKQTALVGASGSGKSTIVGLVERFYDPVGGDVYLDGRNVRDLNLRWLREQISLVQQEPVLFATTIYENIRYGLLGARWVNISEDKTQEMVIEAAKIANAHDFISHLPEGYQTKVGERGFLLSGGQKQRIAIARAIVGDPQILLLDEATSALDTKSEGIVQAALDNAAQGRTTIVIAHRLSTIKNADNIVVMSQGRIVEQGKHFELLERRGAYFSLVQAQKLAAKTQTEATPEAVKEAEYEIIDSPEEANVEEYAADTKENASIKLTRTRTGRSLSSLALESRNKSKPARYSLWQLIKLVLSFNRKEWYLAVIGFLFSIIAGGGQPVQSIFFAKSIQALSLPPSAYGKLRSDINFWSGMYLMLACVMFIANAAHAWAFGYCQEAIIHRARLAAFQAVLRQNIAFFDEENHTSGGLTSFLSTTIIDLAGLSGSTLGTILMVFTTLVASMAISLAIGWKLALVCSSTIPILIFCGYLRFSMLSRFQARSRSAYQQSAGFACEATTTIRTVASLNREGQVWDMYHDQLDAQGKASLRSVAKSSLFYASSQSFVFLCVALGFWYGGNLIADRKYNIFQYFICFQSIVFGAQSAGSIFSFAPDMGKAKHAAEELKTLLDRKPDIDSWSEQGERVSSIDGYVEFRDVHFRYPTRLEQPVLRGLNLSVKPGQYVALVGASGCGKSTTIALLERFYDPLMGQVLVDGIDITKLHLNTYRSFLALVSQEPTLYQDSIRGNILLGADREDVKEEEIIQVCKDANIYEFIMSLPEGFDTVCGAKGLLLSGGQKQRIAIARALLRKPKVLLLDEATSALDSESEKVVQAALDNAARGRTTIAVAHRLSTIQKADIIYVFDSGKIVEQGSHSELLAKRGRYAELVTLQSLEKS